MRSSVALARGGRMAEKHELYGNDRDIEDLVRAHYPLLYVVSAEEKRVEEALKKVARNRDRKLITWSLTEGFTFTDTGSMQDIKDPGRCLEYVMNSEDRALFVLRDFHAYLNDPLIIRRLRDLGKYLKETQKTIIILSPTLKVPVEVEKEVAVMDYDLPVREQIDALIDELLADTGMEPTKTTRDPEMRERVVEAALGLTWEEASNVFRKALVKTRDFDLDIIIQEKKHIIRKSGILEFEEANRKFSDVGGLDVLKAWLRMRQKAFSSKAHDFGLPLPRGILLIGIPGCGKSLTARAVGALWHMPLLRLDVGKVFAGLVGSSEENIRKAIKTAESVAPSILWLDELEKGFSGVKSSGQSDAGTTARVFGTFVTWLQEKTQPVFVIATANDVSQLPPELMRKGRFDEIFFVDLPTAEERKEIFRIHLQKKSRDPEKFDLDKCVESTAGFSGSEIEQIIISALYDAWDIKTEGDPSIDLTTEGIIKSAEEIIPLAFTMKETIDTMRDWAKTRARRASSVMDMKDVTPVRRLEL